MSRKAPLGFPVVPEVYKIYDGSSEFICSQGTSLIGQEFNSASQSKSLSGTGMYSLCPKLTTNTFGTLNSAISTAASIMSLSGVIFPALLLASEQMINFGLASSILTAIASFENPANIIE